MAKTGQPGVGGVKNPNAPFYDVVTKPGGRVGGTNAPVQVSMTPTRYTGGLKYNAPVEVNPK